MIKNKIKRKALDWTDPKVIFFSFSFSFTPQLLSLNLFPKPHLCIFNHYPYLYNYFLNQL